MEREMTGCRQMWTSLEWPVESPAFRGLGTRRERAESQPGAVASNRVRAGMRGPI